MRMMAWCGVSPLENGAMKTLHSTEYHDDDEVRELGEIGGDETHTHTHSHSLTHTHHTIQTRAILENIFIR